MPNNNELDNMRQRIEGSMKNLLENGEMDLKVINEMYNLWRLAELLIIDNDEQKPTGADENPAKSEVKIMLIMAIEQVLGANIWDLVIKERARVKALIEQQKADQEEYEKWKRGEL